MGNKSSMESFDMEEFKNKIEEIKEASAKARIEYEEKKANGELEKQPLGQKVVGMLILAVLLVGVVFALVSNIELMLLPKNSITIVVADENGEKVEGVEIRLHDQTGIYNHKHTDVDNLTLLDMEPGRYMLVFEEIPEGYTTPVLVDNFTLNQDGKVKLEYKCVKENKIK